MRLWIGRPGSVWREGPRGNFKRAVGLATVEPLGCDCRSYSNDWLIMLNISACIDST